jgi:hypothetical protein
MSNKKVLHITVLHNFIILLVIIINITYYS